MQISILGMNHVMYEVKFSTDYVRGHRHGPR